MSVRRRDVRRARRLTLAVAGISLCLALAGPLLMALPAQAANSAPALTSETVAEITSSTAAVHALLNPGGVPTSYQVEYGTSSAYGSTTPEIDVGASAEAVAVHATLSGLEPNTTYHARFSAHNELGTTPGVELTFVTEPGQTSSALLPDHRAFEAVSLAADSLGGEAYPPNTGQESPQGRETFTNYPVRAAADGNAIVYPGEAPPIGGSGSTGSGGGDTFLTTRGPSGWQSADISPPTGNARGTYQGFSSDLSLSFLESFEPLTPSAPSGCIVLFAQEATGSYHPTFTSTETPGECGDPIFAGISGDNSSIVFETSARLTPDAPEASGEHENLYESVAGQPYLVNVLPNGETAPNASIGGAAVGYSHFGDAINSTGSRVVWTDLNTGNLYMRENPAGPDPATVLVAEAAYYRGASSDGSKILFTDERKLTGNSTAAPGEPDLYAYESSAETGKPGTVTDLTVAASGHADVQGLLGASNDASYVYFVAQAALAEGAPSGRECREETEAEIRGETPKSELFGCNLYLWHDGALRFIAMLSPRDNAMLSAETANRGPVSGDWRPALNLRTAEVARDGHSVVFMSRLNLTPYNSLALPEVYVYGADTRVTSCVSCNPGGEPPMPPSFAVSGERVAAFLTTPVISYEWVNGLAASSYQLREISANGARVFFSSAQQLLPQAVQGQNQLYEWEREGEGTCTGPAAVPPRNGGCVFLLSPPLGGEQAVFLDADATGDNVFFTTRAQLASEDRNEQVDVYDARVGGGFPPRSTQCTGNGCQGAAPIPPSFASPPSSTFTGGANFAPQPTTSSHKKRTFPRCKRGHVRRRGKCVRARKRPARHNSTKKGRP